jgi:DUF1365 family protein
MTVALVAGAVMHRRTRPVANAFRYPAFCLRIPLSARADAGALAWNRTGAISFHDRDHDPRDGSHLDAWARSVLAGEGLACDGEIVLYAFPRMLGLVFNPVSFWVCHDARCGVRAVIAEVNNTFGERHLYVLANDAGTCIGSGQTLRARKALHVSPFCEVKGEYRFRFHFGADRWLARVDYYDDVSAATPVLETSISGMVEPLPRRAAALFWRYRWFTLGVIARIHLQAAKLWLRRVPWFTKPAPPPLPVTRNA